MNNQPFLKWAGSKRELLHHIHELIPTSINNYYEPFIGGGSVLISLLKLKKADVISINRIYAYDLNEGLIYLYKNIQTNYTELSNRINQYVREYNDSKDVEEQKTFYYSLRTKIRAMDKKTIDASAIFLILNKLCFRGLYKEGPHGFNVGFGYYKKTPKIASYEELKYMSELFKDVIFQVSDFKDSLNQVIENDDINDFVYLDPPYAPEHAESFVKYNKQGFNYTDHMALFDKIKQLPCNFLLSNSNTDLVRNAFNTETYNIKEIQYKRRLCCKSNKKPITTELLISN